MEEIKVKVEVQGRFSFNGKIYEKGDIVEVPEMSSINAMIQLGDLKIVKDEKFKPIKEEPKKQVKPKKEKKSFFRKKTSVEEE